MNISGFNQVKLFVLALLPFVFYVASAEAEMAHSKHHQMMKEHHGQSDHHSQSEAEHHDMQAMPGLQGKDTTDDEVDELANLFNFHFEMTRRVENLPNGIRTITETDNEALRDKLIAHVTGMITRIEEGRNPEVIIQSPTLDKLFGTHSQITTEIEITDKGIAVIQTSDNPAVVKNLQTHAGEVSDMVERGMQAVHERMDKHGMGHDHKHEG